MLHGYMLHGYMLGLQGGFCVHVGPPRNMLIIVMTADFIYTW